MVIVEAYLDLTSPYCYLASTQIDHLVMGTGARFRLYPVVVDDLFEPGASPLQGASGQYRPDYRDADVTAWAEYYNVPFRNPRGRLQVDPYMLARAAIAAASSEQRGPIMHRLFAAQFVEARPTLDANDVCGIAAAMGIDSGVIREALVDPMVEAERLAIVERAKSLGVFGVPSFVTRDRCFFGNDRLSLLTHHLLALSSV